MGRPFDGVKAGRECCQANATARIVQTSRNATSRSALLEISHSNMSAPFLEI